MMERRMVGRMVRALAVFLFVGLCALRMDAQVTGASIAGTVTDQTKAYVRNADIMATNVSTGVVTRTKSNSKGFYTLSNLLPGVYDVNVAAPTFSTSIHSNLVLTVGQSANVDVSLVPGKALTVIQVTTGAPAVEAETSMISGVVDEHTVTELPLNTRDWTQLAALQPGVSALHTQLVIAGASGAARGNRGYGQQLTISGNRPEQNSYRLDGITINDYANGAPGSVLGGNLGVDAVEEFSVLTGNYPAEYGMTSGGVVNAITKSGSNRFHGDVYEFYRNSVMDARNYFDPAQKAPFQKNQYGGSAGGPIIKDKTFIFGDYEGVQQNTTQTSLVTVPSANARNGIFVGQAPFTPNPTAQKTLNFYPLPDAGGTTGDTGTATTLRNQVVAENYFTVRLDHALTKKDALDATYVFDHAHTTQPDLINATLLGQKTNRQIGTLGDSHTFTDKFLDTVHVGFNEVLAFAGETVSPINPLSSDTSLGLIAGQTSPIIQFSDGSVTTMPGGFGASPHYNFDWRTYQFFDDAFWTKGINSIKFGFAYDDIHSNVVANSDANGTLVYNSVPTFLQNGPVNSIDAVIPGHLTPRKVRVNVIGMYAQDDMRARPNLTLNLGLRYEISTVPTEVDGKLSTLLQFTDVNPQLGSPFFSNPTLHNFEPRIGFSWDPTNKGKTVIRSGFGVFDVLPLPYIFEIMIPLAAPFYELANASHLPGGLYPGGLFGQLGGASSLEQNFVQQHPKRNYVLQWNFNVEHDFGASTSVMLAYVGNRGIHQAFRADDINSVQPLNPQSNSPLYPGTDAFGNPLGTQLNPNVGDIAACIWNSDSYYNALEGQVTKRMSHGLQGGIAYTYGKSIDTGSSTIAGDTFTNSVSSLPIQEHLRRGPSDFDNRQNLVVNFLWQAPDPKLSNRALEAVSNGWQLSGEYQASTGIVFTPTVGGDPLGQSGTDPWDFPDRVGGGGCSSMVNPGNHNAYIKLQCLAAPNPFNRRGNLTRNALTGPPLQNLDMAFIKNNPISKISDTFNMQLRFETFNLANHANFAPPIDNATVFAGQTNTAGTAYVPAPVPFAGLIDSTSTFSRQLQLGIKIIW